MWRRKQLGNIAGEKKGRYKCVYYRPIELTGVHAWFPYKISTRQPRRWLARETEEAILVEIISPGGRIPEEQSSRPSVLPERLAIRHYNCSGQLGPRWTREGRRESVRTVRERVSRRDFPFTPDKTLEITPRAFDATIKLSTIHSDCGTKSYSNIIYYNCVTGRWTLLKLSSSLYKWCPILGYPYIFIFFHFFYDRNEFDGKPLYRLFSSFLPFRGLLLLVRWCYSEVNVNYLKWSVSKASNILRVIFSSQVPIKRNILPVNAQKLEVTVHHIKYIFFFTMWVHLRIVRRPHC